MPESHGLIGINASLPTGVREEYLAGFVDDDGGNTAGNSVRVGCHFVHGRIDTFGLTLKAIKW